jgi:hypothetical protein
VPGNKICTFEEYIPLSWGRKSNFEEKNLVNFLGLSYGREILVFSSAKRFEVKPNFGNPEPLEACL